MQRRTRRVRRWRSRVTGILGIASVLVLPAGEGLAQNFTTDVQITTGNEPSLFLQQDNSQGLGAQAWAVAGNETGFFLDDVTGGQTPFSIFAGAPDNSLVVASNGRIGMGASVPSGRLHVVDDVNGNSFIWVQNPNTGTSAAGVLRAQSDVATVNFQAHAQARTIARFGLPSLGGWAEFLQVSGNGLAIGTLTNVPLVLGANNTMRLRATAAGVEVFGTFVNSSSREYKEDVRALTAEEAVAGLAGLEPVKFRFKEQQEENLGFIAEEVPDVVAVEGRRSVAPMDVIALLTKVVKEQQHTITKQEQQLMGQAQTVSELRMMMTELTARLQALEYRATRSEN